jgi:hypothetical protein
MSDKQSAGDAAAPPPEASSDAVHAEQPLAETPTHAAEAATRGPTGRLRRTVSWADTQPDKAQGLFAVREFEPRCGRRAARQPPAQRVSETHARGARGAPQRNGGLGGWLHRRIAQELLHHSVSASRALPAAARLRQPRRHGEAPRSSTAAGDRAALAFLGAWRCRAAGGGGQRLLFVASQGPDGLRNRGGDAALRCWRCRRAALGRLGGMRSPNPDVMHSVTPRPCRAPQHACARVRRFGPAARYARGLELIQLSLAIPAFFTCQILSTRRKLDSFLQQQQPASTRRGEG